MNMEQENMKIAIKLAQQSIDKQNGGPFGAVIFKDGILIGKGINQVTALNDPTAHAEVNAIRNACQNLKTFDLSGSEIYTTCEPCPMCLGAIYWAKIDKIYFAANREDAANAGFIDDFIYKEFSLPWEKRNLESVQILKEEAIKIFENWNKTENKIPY
jgi:tRNA(Arg) A34 adenosine deaminase TadA